MHCHRLPMSDRVLSVDTSCPLSADTSCQLSADPPPYRTLASAGGRRSHGSSEMTACQHDERTCSYAAVRSCPTRSAPGLRPNDHSTARLHHHTYRRQTDLPLAGLYFCTYILSATRSTIGVFRVGTAVGGPPGVA